MHTTRSAFVRTAVAYYIHDMRRKKMEEELAAGYMANAICAQRVAEELMGAEGDLV
jgi:metal-responsive CopG/Arc/MetJ family transcriptional regulator